ncbi:hypothetical protein TcCL_Unassigned02454 [Trypanosoma cruzi]|nr:hypothetical protein TcCL_Unassigned02454 [Trypanosoma cruzi]
MQRPPCVQQSVTCIFVSVELAGAARRCRRPLIAGLLRPFFLSARWGKQLFLHAMCWSASILPTGHHAAVSLRCHSHCGFIFTNWLCVRCNARVPHRTRGSLSFVFCGAIARGPQLGGCLLFKCFIFIYAVGDTGE